MFRDRIRKAVFLLLCGGITLQFAGCQQQLITLGLDIVGAVVLNAILGGTTTTTT